MYVKNSNDSQEEKKMVRDDIDKDPNDWSRDGKYILYTGGTDLRFVTVPELKSNMFLKAESALRNGQFSRDGKWVAYTGQGGGAARCV